MDLIQIDVVCADRGCPGERERKGNLAFGSPNECYDASSTLRFRRLFQLYTMIAPLCCDAVNCQPAEIALEPSPPCTPRAQLGVKQRHPLHARSPNAIASVTFCKQ